MNRPCPTPLAIPFERVGDGLPFVEIVEANLLNGELIEKQGNTAHGGPDEAEPPCRDELRNDACWHWAASFPEVPPMALVAPRSASGRRPGREAFVGAAAAHPPSRDRMQSGLCAVR